ncbi:40S Ribosomal Protein S4, X Isoform [Manis pentadactyla]|nr:40S Ribosomal Protein S4, X Isoform [Manis pentadactyla]
MDVPSRSQTPAGSQEIPQPAFLPPLVGAVLLGWAKNVIHIDKNRENFHLTYDSKTRFAAHHSAPEEARYKSCKVRKTSEGTRGTPHLVAHDAHTKYYADPFTKENGTIQTGLETSKMTSVIKFDTGNQRC